MREDSIKRSMERLVQAGIQLGKDRQRVEFFQAFRLLMHEKDVAGDQIAVDVLSWAYAKLAQDAWFETRLEQGIDGTSSEED